MKVVLGWLINLLIIFLIFLIASSIFTMVQAKLNPKSIPSFLGYRPFTILSGSMQPLLEEGDMILVKPVEANSVEAGDVITFWTQEEILVTHRVVDIVQQEDGGMGYKTKGDANEVEDHQLVAGEQLIGKLVLDIPKGGYVAEFVQTPKGIILCILLPFVLLVLSEVKAVRSFLRRRRKTVT